MKICSTILLSVLAFFCYESNAVGQINKLQFGLSRIVNFSGVHTELELSDDQVCELEILTEDINSELLESVASIQAEIDNARTETGELDVALVKELLERQSTIVMDLQSKERKKVKEILLDDQFTRLKQIFIQSIGVEAILLPEIQKKLAINRNQIPKLRKSISSESKKLKKSMSQANLKGKAWVKEYQKLRRVGEQEILAHLSSSQRGKFKRMLGKKFNFYGDVEEKQNEKETDGSTSNE